MSTAEIVQSEKHATAAVKRLIQAGEPPAKIVADALLLMREINKKQGWYKRKKENSYEHQARIKGFSMHLYSLKAMVDTALVLVKMDEAQNNYDMMTLEELDAAWEKLPDEVKITKTEVSVGPIRRKALGAEEGAAPRRGALPVRAVRGPRKPARGIPSERQADQGYAGGERVPGARDGTDGCVDGPEVSDLRDQESVLGSGASGDDGASGAPGA